MCMYVNVCVCNTHFNLYCNYCYYYCYCIGTTNKRLILHYPLKGSDGVKFVVGENEVMSYGGDDGSGGGGDGSIFIFDDSFEHHVYHQGKEDRFVLLAVLKHPNAEY